MRSQEEASAHKSGNCTCRIPPPPCEELCTCLKNGHQVTSNGIKNKSSHLPSDPQCDVDSSDSELHKIEYKIPRIQLKPSQKSTRRDRDKEHSEIWIRGSISPDARRTVEKKDVVCRKCGCTVYATERVELENDVIYHDRCFRCGQCGVKLTLANFCTDHRLADDVYCRTHRPFSRASHVDGTSMHISVARNQPRLNVTSGEIRYTGNVARYDATALCIQSVLNTPKVWERPPSYFHTSNIANDVVKGDIIGLKYL